MDGQSDSNCFKTRVEDTPLHPDTLLHAGNHLESWELGTLKTGTMKEAELIWGYAIRLINQLGSWALVSLGTLSSHLECTSFIEAQKSSPQYHTMVRGCPRSRVLFTCTFKLVHVSSWVTVSPSILCSGRRKSPGAGKERFLLLVQARLLSAHGYDNDWSIKWAGKMSEERDCMRYSEVTYKCHFKITGEMVFYLIIELQKLVKI